MHSEKEYFDTEQTSKDQEWGEQSFRKSINLNNIQ